MNTHAEEDRILRGAIEHTLLSAAARVSAIESLCAEALSNAFHGVCVNPVHVARCAQRLRGSGLAVISVVGFPLGATFARCKALECELVILDGATEVDMVMHLSAAIEGDFDAVEADARAVVEAAAGRPVKLIIETGLLNQSQKISACDAAARAGISFVKTCSGFAPGVATPDDVELLRRTLGVRLGIKASGGIRSAVGAKALLAAGADRLGTSAGVQIVRELEAVAS